MFHIVLVGWSEPDAPRTIDDLQPADPSKDRCYPVNIEEWRTIEKDKKKTPKLLGVYLALREIAAEEESPEFLAQLGRVRGIYKMRNKEVKEALVRLKELGIINVTRPSAEAIRITFRRTN